MASTLYIGTRFIVNKIQYKDGQTTFSNAPYVVLRNKAAGKYIGVTATAISGSIAYMATFTASDTLKLIPGIYNIEVYATSAMTDMLKSFKEEVRAELAAASGEAHNQEEFDDESSSN